MKKNFKASLNSANGFTLIELALIIVIIGIVATIAMRSMESTIDQSRVDATIQEMEILTQAIVGNKNLISDGIRTDFGYIGDIGALPPGLDALVSNPGGYATWNGPYILNNFTQNPNDYKEDAWGDAYIYAGDIVITSSGNGTPISRQFAGSTDDLLSNTVYGNVYDGLGAVPGDSASNINIIIYYPDGAGSTAAVSTSPTASGQFSYSDMIPIGNHLVRAVYSIYNDTTSTYTTVLPGNDAYCELRFSKACW